MHQNKLLESALDQTLKSHLKQFMTSFPYKRQEFQVEMTCEGCSGAVNRVLNKKGIKILLG